MFKESIKDHFKTVLVHDLCKVLDSTNSKEKLQFLDSEVC